MRNRGKIFVLINLFTSYFVFWNKEKKKHRYPVTFSVHNLRPSGIIVKVVKAALSSATYFYRASS